MNAIKFPQANIEFTKPQGWTDEQCHSLSAWRGEDSNTGPVIISAWIPTPEEIDDMKVGKPVFLAICGHAMPPVSLFTANPFEPAPAKLEIVSK